MSDAYLKSVVRTSAWVLLAAIVISVVSGWGITRTEVIYNFSFHLIDRGVANSIHRGLQIPMAIVFLTHILANAKLALRRRKTGIVNALLVVLGVVLLAAVIYMEKF